MRKILKYTQTIGFEDIDSPFEWPEGGDLDDYLKAGGFGGEMMCEEADGQFAYNEAIRHWYNEEDGSRFTIVSGANRYEMIWTANAADHLALRIALAPLAHAMFVQTVATVCSEYGTLEKWQKEEREQARQESLRRKASLP